MNDSIVDNSAPRRFLPSDTYGRIAAILLGGVALVLILIIAGALRNMYRPYRYPRIHESGLRAGLHQIRNAIEAFKTDTGVYPAALTDLSAADAGGVKAKIKPGSYKGPYLSIPGGIGKTGIPRNPFLSPRVPLDQSGIDEMQIESHWTYDAREGVVHPAFPREGTTYDDTPYSEL